MNDVQLRIGRQTSGDACAHTLYACRVCMLDHEDQPACWVIKKWDWHKRQKELLRRSSLPSALLSGRPQNCCLNKTQSWLYFYLLCVLPSLQHFSTKADRNPWLETASHFLHSATWQVRFFSRGLSSMGQAINLLLVPSCSLWVLSYGLPFRSMHFVLLPHRGLPEWGRKVAVISAPPGNLCSPSSASVTMEGAKLRSSFHLSKNTVQPQWMEGLQQFVLHYISIQCLN